MFEDILSSNLPPEDLTLNRLQNEAMSMVGAGVETTKWALSVGCFHILANPPVKARLVAELEAAIPDPHRIIPWSELEKLPYLSAIVLESQSFSLHLLPSPPTPPSTLPYHKPRSHLLLP